MPKAKSTITGIELGTSAIKLVLGEPRDDGNMVIHAIDEVKTQNKIVKGEIIHVDAIEEALAKALNKLETTSGQRIRTISLAISGRHVGSTNAQSSVPITGPDRTIGEHHAAEALGHAQAYSLPIDKRALHRYQRPYMVDDARSISDPLGIVANRLTANIQVIYGNENTIRTAEAVIGNVTGELPDELCFSGVAAYYGLGLHQTSTNGSLVIDIGAGVTEYALIHDDTCQLAGQVTVGCEHLANDLAIGLGLPIARCREILRRDVTARPGRDDTGVIQVETTLGNPPRAIPKAAIHTIARARLAELLDVVRDQVQAQDMLRLVGDRILLCGGGALIAGLPDLAQEVFRVPASIGRPSGITCNLPEIDSPRMVTPVGLLHYAHHIAQVKQQEDPTFWQVFTGDCRRLGGLLRKAFRL